MLRNALHSGKCSFSSEPKYPDYSLTYQALCCQNAVSPVIEYEREISDQHLKNFLEISTVNASSKTFGVR